MVGGTGEVGVAGEAQAQGWQHRAGWQQAGRPFSQGQAQLDARVFVRVVLGGGDGVDRRVRVFRHRDDSVLRQLQIDAAERPYGARDRRGRQGRQQQSGVAYEAADLGLGHRAVRHQDAEEPRAGCALHRCGRHLVEHDFRRAGGDDSAAHPGALAVRVGQLEDVAGAHVSVVQGGLIGDCLGLGTLGVKYPLAQAVSLPTRAAGHGGDPRFPPPKGDDAVRVFVDLWDGLASVLRVIPHHHRDGVPFPQASAAVLEVAVDDVARGDDLDRVGRLVSDRHYGVGTPVGHASEYAGQGAEGDQRLFLIGKDGVAGEPWLHAAVPVGHQLVAVLRDAIQRPLVDVRDARADDRVGGQVVESPRRVVRPRLLE
ncbi:hypothetical protein D3C85_749500 [compost metagenome]